MKATPRTANSRRMNRSSRPEGASPPVPVLFRFPNLVTDEADPVTGETAEVSVAHSAVAPVSEASTQTAAVRADESQSPTRAVSQTAGGTAVAAAELSHSGRSTESAKPATVGTMQRSWWEHWSSGIVLLLLVVAMVSASVVAFRDTGDEQLALEQDVEEFGIPSLDDIQIDVDSGSLATMPMGGAEFGGSEAEADAAPLSPTEAALAGDDSLIPESLELANNGANNAANQAKASEAEEFSSVMVGHPIASGNGLASSGLDNALAAEAQAMQEAADQSQAPRGFTLPTVQVSHPSGTPGGSPGLYDGAQAGPSTENSATGLANQSSTTDADNTTLTPMYSGVVRSEPNTQVGQTTPLQPSFQPGSTNQSNSNQSDSLVGGSSSLAESTAPATIEADQAGPTTQLTSTGSSSLPLSNASMTREVDSATQQPSATQPQGPVLTATPEFDVEACIKAWREYESNRYRSR